MTDDLPDLLRIAEQAVGLGYDIIKNTTPSEIRLKSDRDTVTDVDLKIENEVREFLRRMTPAAGFLGEEEASTASLDGDQDVWTLDPVDGTSNFAHGLPLCAVSLALVRGGAPVVAAMVAPFLNLRYLAAKGHGAFGNGVRIRVSATTELSQSIVSIGDYAVGDEAAAKNERRIRLTTLLAERVERIRMFGSAALDLAWVAEGRTDAAVIMANKPWDTAAGVLLAREAGANVVDATGAAHSFTSSETIAVNPHIQRSLLSLTSKIPKGHS
ncbi:inositol monophosphatase family protein [Actinophytocola xanthii]|uniref:Inositol-1-monophosphatase n=1 Tax=Actinophytocola xanthii TaxID=1912961 RepID=A0A1Q8CX37_9PSEU|nr:inositol monophosphatase family protein [Actinophytocola xanthii]OLF18920.1 inositol monophosphatase [Actinophytocola xanthii]